MKNKQRWILKNLHLLISIAIVIPTAIIYGYSPTTIISKFLNIPVTTNDLSNLLRVIMFLYLGTSFIWLLGVYKSKFWELATQLNILFMISLAMGRILSILIDGLPSEGYIFGVIAELVLGLYSIFQLNKYHNQQLFR